MIQHISRIGRTTIRVVISRISCIEFEILCYWIIKILIISPSIYIGHVVNIGDLI